MSDDAFEQYFQAAGAAAAWVDGGLLIRLSPRVLELLLEACRNQQKDRASVLIQTDRVFGRPKEPAKC